MSVTAEQILTRKKQEIISIPVGSTIAEAIAVMNEHRIGAVLIAERDDLVGIWTERDLLREALAEGFDIRSALVDAHMSTEIKYAEHDETIYQLEDKFLGMRLRHLPVRKAGVCIGVLSVGDVMKSLLNEKESQLRELNALTSWEYYENWRFEK